MNELTVDIDGIKYPLSECDWVLFKRCGCPQAVMVAVLTSGEIIAATEEMAWREMFETKKEANKAQRSGGYLTLMTHEKWVTDVLPFFTSDSDPHEAKS